MAEELSRLEAVELREIWDTEAQHFTPWLAEEENLTLLGETLGMKELEIEGTEINVGDFRADILCKNEDGSRVLIENQLEETDHSHLGQILTYAAGLDVQTVIWIAKTFKDEHRAALDRLNEIAADKGFRFFGVEIRVWQIEDSARAPQFDVVSSPNNWSRTVSQDTQNEMSKNLSETQLQQEKYWTKLRDYMSQSTNQFKFPKPQAAHYLQFNIGRSDFGIRTWQRRKNDEIGVSIYITGQNAKAYFHLLMEQREELENEFGDQLEWSEEPERNERRIDLQKNDTDPTDESDWNNQHEWLAEKLHLFDKVFRPRIKALNASDWEPPEDVDDE